MVKDYLKDIEDVVDSIYNVNNKLKDIKEKSKKIGCIDLDSLKQKLCSIEEILKINARVEAV
jgi:hypothetical protein